MEKRKDLLESLQNLGIVGKGRPSLEVSSLVYTEGEKAGMNLEVMAAYLKYDLRRANHCAHFAFATIENVNLTLYALEVKAAFLTSAHVAFVAYQDDLQWRLMIVRHKRPTLHYDPCLATRFIPSQRARELSKLLNPSMQTMSWPQQSNPIDSGPLVILAVQKYIGLVHILPQRMFNEEVARFRGPALRKLAEMFDLTLDDQPYTPPAFATEQIVQQKPKLDIQLLLDSKARIDTDLMYAFMNFLLEGSIYHAFRVVDNADDYTPAQLYEDINIEFRNSAVTTFYVAYYQMKRWRLIMVHKQTRFQHYDPADPTDKVEGVISEYAKALMRLLFAEQNMNLWENPQWPRIKSRADSGAYVLLAVEYHRDHPLSAWSIQKELVDAFRSRMVTQLQWDYQLTAFGRPYAPPQAQLPMPLPPTIAKP